MDKDKEEIRKAAERYANDVCRGSHHRWGMEQVCMADFIEGAEWYKKQSSWISVNEKLPELRERVLVAYWSIGKISICIMRRLPHDTANPNNPKWYWSLENNKGNVIAWMPLPHFDETLLKRKETL